MRTLSALALLATLSALPSAFAGDPMPATTIDEGSGISETKFSNGLTLLVKPQPDNPACACFIWYTVGSRDEDVGETGLSHYLEHMLFKGTKKLPVGSIDKITQ